MKYYTRIGRRFVQIENLYGMYANWDGTYSKEKRSNSYGVVVIHNFKEVVIAHLKVIPNVTWYTAIKKYNLPTRLQVLAAYDFQYRFESPDENFWTKEEDYLDDYAWHSWRFSELFHCSFKDKYLCVREFTTIKL